MSSSSAPAASTDDEPHLTLPTSVTFTEVFLEHHGTCLRQARRLVRDDVLAHDVVQEVFLAWWRTGGGAYRADRGALGAWLSTITHHKAVDAVRSSERHARLRSAAEAAVPTSSEQRLVDDVVWWELGKERLREALPTLPLKQREVLSLVYLAGMTQAEVAERLGIPLGTVKSRTHAGLLRLKAAVSGSWTPTGPEADEPDGRPRACAEVRSVPGPSWARSAAPGRHDDVERCAAAVVRAASTELDDAPAAVRSLSCALVEQHGADSLHALVVALARLAATPLEAACADR